MKVQFLRTLAVGTLCAFVLAACGLLIAAQPAEAAVSAYNYSSAKALSYAKAHCKDKKAYDGGKNDCVKFVRKAIETGGIPSDKFHKYGYTPNDYVDYLTSNGLAEQVKLVDAPWTHTWPNGSVWNEGYRIFKAAQNPKASLGDVLAYKCNKCGKWFHVALIGGKSGDAAKNIPTPGMLTNYAHNVAQNNQLVLKIKCSRCKAAPTKTDIYVLHFRSAENGYANIAPAKTSIKKLTSKAKKTLTFTLAKKGDVTGYEVRYGRSTAMKGATTKTVKGASKNAIKVKSGKIQSGKNYYCQARSYTIVDGVKYVSDWTPVKKVKAA